MEAIYTTLLLLLSVSLVCSMYVSPEYSQQEVEDFLKDSQPIKASDDEAEAAHWLEEILRPIKSQASTYAMKKRLSTDFLFPQRPMHKRNNGVWIWMPAQGYVNMPKGEEGGENESRSKNGKIMRYGR